MRRETIQDWLKEVQTEFSSQKDIAFLNSKGFGGNNATSALISSSLTEELLQRRFTEKELKAWKKKREATLKLREKNFELAVNSDIEPIYEFDKDHNFVKRIEANSADISSLHWKIKDAKIIEKDGETSFENIKKMIKKYKKNA